MSICKPRKNLAALLRLLFPPPLPRSPPLLSKRLAASGCCRTSLKEQQLAAVFIVKTRVVPLSALPPEFHLSSLLTRLPLCLPLPPSPPPLLASHHGSRWICQHVPMLFITVRCPTVVLLLPLKLGTNRWLELFLTSKTLPTVSK